MNYSSIKWTKLKFGDDVNSNSLFIWQVVDEEKKKEDWYDLDTSTQQFWQQNAGQPFTQVAGNHFFFPFLKLLINA